MNRAICIVGTLAAAIPISGMSALAACFSTHFESMLNGRPLPFLSNAMLDHPLMYLGFSSIILIYGAILYFRASLTLQQAILHVLVFNLVAMTLLSLLAIAVVLPLPSHIEPLIK